MADDKADKTVVVEEPQQEAVEESPTSDNQTEDSKQPEVLEKISDQNRAFAEMRNEIKELKVQLEEAKKLSSSSKPQLDYSQQPVGTQYVDVNQYINPQTGEFNATAYNQAVNSTLASQADYNQQLVQQEVDFAQAKIAFPKLDPTNEEYDPIFEEDVAARYHFLNFVQGKATSLKQIAKEISSKQIKEEKKEAAKLQTEMDEVKDEKNIASLETPGQSASAVRAAQTRMDEEADEEELKYRTRGLKGDVFSGQRYSEQEQLKAAAERFKKIPWTLPEETETVT